MVTTKKKTLAKGFTCKCGKYHAFSVYVYAHWQETLIYTCPKCGERYEVCEGIASITPRYDLGGGGKS